MPPVHDYVIANGTGAAVRSDLNDALAAIVSNNSSSSEPATTYAYQWWADTTANVLKIRNSANNAWITLRELDGTMLIEDGTAAAPGLSFASDTNTGIFRPSNNALAVSANGSVRMTMSNSSVVVNQDGEDVDFRVESNGNTHMLFVDAANNRVGINESAPSQQFVTANSGYSAIEIKSGRTSASDNIGAIHFKSSSTNVAYIQSQVDGTIKFRNTSSLTERARIDSDGRLLVGTSSNTAPVSFDAKLQIADTSYTGSISLRRDSNTAGSSSLVFGKSRGSLNGNTIVQDGDALGGIAFYGADGTDLNSDAASIYAYVDGTPGSNDMPGRIVFSTCADGSSSATERLRIDSSGNVAIGTTSIDRQFHVQGGGVAGTQVQIEGTVDSAGIKFVPASGADQYEIQATDNSALIFYNRTDLTERMRITNSGLVGIGSSSPNATLEVSSAGTCTLNLVSDNDNNGTNNDSLVNFRVDANNNTPVAALGYDQSEGNFQISTNGTRAFRIDSAQRILLDTTSNYDTGYKVSLNMVNTGGIIYRMDGSGTRQPARFTNSSGTVVGSISTTTTATTYNTTSDYRLKENVVDIADGITRVKQLQPKRFNFIADADTTVDGFLAHEAQTVVPEAVTGTHNGVEVWKESEELPEGVSLGDNKLDEDGNTIPEYQGIDQAKLVPLLTAALQEAIAKIETLETKVAALEAG